MLQVPQLIKSLFGCLQKQQEEQCSCDALEEYMEEGDEDEMQQSSGIGTLMLICAILAVLFIGLGVNPKHRMEKMQNTKIRSKTKLLPENWVDAVEPTCYEEQRQTPNATPSLSGTYIYFDIPNDDINLEVQQFFDAAD